MEEIQWITEESEPFKTDIWVKPAFVPITQEDTFAEVERELLRENRTL